MQRQDPRVTAAYESVVAEYDVFVQAANLPRGLLDPRDSETPDAHRRMLVRQLQRTLPAFASASVRADTTRSPADVFARTEQLVKAAIIEQAHQSETLRAVVSKDQVGREQVEFYGQKSSWMNAYKAPVMMTKAFDGRPVRLPVV